MEFLPRPGPGLKRGVGHSNEEGKRKLKSMKQTLNSEFWYRLTIVFSIEGIGNEAETIIIVKRVLVRIVSTSGSGVGPG